MEEAPKSCGCSGIRSCLVCNPKAQNPKAQKTQSVTQVCWFCPTCGKFLDGDISGRLCPMNDHKESWCVLHENRQPDCTVHVDGIEVHPEFITEEEEKYLAEEIDKHEWKMSQSGRHKQDFGPQVNFKRKKVKMGSFEGFPEYSEFIVDRMSGEDSLADFHPVELCNLEYAVDRGSTIDPHIDDTWIWGDQLVTINLISNTILTLTKVKSSQNKTSENHTSKNADENASDDNTSEINTSDNDPTDAMEIQIPMPARSLVIVSGDARYLWEHGVKREHVGTRRLAMTFRNLSRGFLSEDKQQDIIKQLVDVCATFKTIL